VEPRNAGEASRRSRDAAPTRGSIPISSAPNIATRRVGRFFDDVREYIRALAGATRWRLAYACALVVVCSVTEGFGLALLLPTLQLAGVEIGPHSEAGRFAALVRGALRAIGLRASLTPLLLLFVAIVSVRAILARTEGLAITVVYETFTQHLRQRLFEAVSQADWLFICKSRSADFLHGLTEEVDRAGVAAHEGLYTVSGAAMTTLYAATSLILFPAVTLLLLGLCCALALWLRAKTRAVHRAGYEFSAVTKAVYSAAMEHFQSIKTAKIYGAQQRICEIFSRLTRDMALSSLGMTREQLSADACFEVGSAVMMGGILLVAIEWLALSPSEILILLILFARLVPRVRLMQSSYRGFVSQLPGFVTVTNIEERCRAAAEPTVSAGLPSEFRRSVRLENVWFTYPGGQVPVLRGIDLTISACRTIAIVGASGAGKSSIADLVMGLMRPGSGRIMIDGMPLDAGYAQSWREKVGYVAQDTFLFHDTVRANLLWARPAATEAELREALRVAAADEFVARLPNGLDTVVGDRGAALSQGEQQRLALARGLLRQPRLLVLDEATNSLDSESETRIFSALERIPGITTVLIAHRLSTIRWADFIYVIEGGQVVESGNWTTLAAKLDGRFRSWCVAQGIAA
jgi:ATP-binding cassette, subfamily C, bacterial